MVGILEESEKRYIKDKCRRKGVLSINAVRFRVLKVRAEVLFINMPSISLNIQLLIQFSVFSYIRSFLMINVSENMPIYYQNHIMQKNENASMETF